MADFPNSSAAEAATLEQTTIDEDLTGGSDEKVFRACDSSGRAEKLDLHNEVLAI
jgi:hypothetical protein